MNRRLVLFDFDGTITSKDSFIELIKYYKGLSFFYCGIALLSPMLLLFKAKLIKNWKAKEIVFRFFFRNESYNVFMTKCSKFCKDIVPILVKPSAIERINTHLKNGDKVIIISASLEVQLIGWCQSMNLELIGTKIETRDGLITGKIEGKNCYGIEKVKRLKQYLDISQYNEIYAYGDSKGDLQMLELATHKFFRTI
jgi:phosphatidylglycerophosphatase C